MAVISAETKIQAVEQCYAGAGSLNQIAERFGVHRSTLQKWLLNYVISLSWYARTSAKGLGGPKKTKGIEVGKNRQQNQTEWTPPEKGV